MSSDEPVRGGARLDDLARRLLELLERARRGVRVEAGGANDLAVVEQHRVADVERHRPLHALGRVGVAAPQEQRVAVEARRPRCTPRTGTNESVSTITCTVYSGTCTRSGRLSWLGLQVLVDDLLVAALVLQRDADLRLARVVLVGQRGQRLLEVGGHPVPERDLDRLIGRVERVDRARRERVEQRRLGRRRRDRRTVRRSTSRPSR